MAALHVRSAVLLSRPASLNASTFHDGEALWARATRRSGQSSGRIRDRKGRKALPYISRVLRTAEKAVGTPGRFRQTSRFTGARIGRGGAQGALAATGRRTPGRRRVVIKTRVVRMKGTDLGAARTHLRYIQRDGVTREGAPGELYDAAGEAPTARRSSNAVPATATSFASS